MVDYSRSEVLAIIIQPWTFSLELVISPVQVLAAVCLFLLFIYLVVRILPIPALCMLMALILMVIGLTGVRSADDVVYRIPGMMLGSGIMWFLASVTLGIWLLAMRRNERASHALYEEKYRELMAAIVELEEDEKLDIPQAIHQPEFDDTSILNP